MPGCDQDEVRRSSGEQPDATAVASGPTPAAVSVLVVEDEPLVREMVRAFLERAGYGVATVGSAEEVLECWSDRAVDLLLTDVMLPGRTGVDLARTLRHDRPELKVLYMSGQSPGGTGPDSETRFLAKPFSRAALLDAVGALTKVG